MDFEETQKDEGKQQSVRSTEAGQYAPDAPTHDAGTIVHSEQGERPLLAGRYRLAQELGRGSFGAVYKAVDNRFDSNVAVKILQRAASAEEFRREAKLTRQFKHPNVVEVYDYGLDHGSAFVVMELLDGLPLDKLFSKFKNKLPPAILRRFVNEATSALQNAHDQNLVHRDFKPNNVMLVDIGKPAERFVLLDFGVSTKTDNTATLANVANAKALTPAYAPPEQWRGEKTGPAADIYAFGATMFQLLTGRKPFQRRTAFEMYDAVQTKLPPRFSEIGGVEDIDPQLEELVQACLAKLPADRPATIREVGEKMLQAIDQAHPGLAATGTMSTVTAAGTSTSIPVIRQATFSTHKWVMLLTSLVVLGSAIGGIGWLLSQLGTRPVDESQVAVSIQVRNEVDLQAGAEQSLDVRIESDAGRRFQLVFADVPNGIAIQSPVEIEGGTTTTVRLTVDLNIEPGERQIRLLARDGEEELTQSIRLIVGAPDVWMPDEDFWKRGQDGGRVAEIRHSSISGRHYYAQIDRVLPDGSRVPFVLIEDESRRALPFFLMRDKVWNSLFQAFCEAQPAAKVGEDWKAGGVREGMQLGVTEGKFPVLNVSVDEAYLCAKWLAGTHGNLPSIAQWNMAAGFRTDKADSLPAGTGPFQGEWSETGKLGLAVAPRGLMLVGTAKDDIGPQGCRDMAANGRELTRDLIFSSGEHVPLENPTADDLVRVRGASYSATRPFLYEDFPRLDNIPYVGRSPDVGFRVVRETQ
ncbi:MAG: bifunctional serine/threonine-protein kinase/formylglycine-generating enzyme family protein [Planctomycetota bacterium]|nr:bifunctional serine/threonine-protein kinase/formylglycine-generating enzyme family protein [Planctomycetota bacterium]